jgi:hypothetical protein
VTAVAAALLPGVVLAFLPFMSRSLGLRAAFLRAVLVTAVLLLVATELLSLVHGLRPGVITAFWTLVLLVALGVSARDREDGRLLVRCWRWVFERLSLGTRLIIRTPSVLVMLLVIVAVLGLTLLTALASPPNNWDSMTYHLPRVMHWSVDHTLRNYPTGIDRQLYLGPFAEYVLLHLYLLTGSDLLFNAVQWMALFLCAVLVSVIARQLGGDRRAQALAALAAVTVPMAILQASTTQNDLVEAVFLMMTVHACLVWRSYDHPRPVEAWQVGAALGLALMAKNTGVIYAGPFVVLALAASWRRPRALLAPAGVALGVVIALNLGLALRNEHSFDSPLGSKVTTAAVKNTHLSLGVTLVNSARLFGSAATTTHPSLNQHLLGLQERTAKAFGVDPADPGILYGASQYSLSWRVQEDFAGFPAQVLAALLIGLAALARIRPLRGLPAAYAAASAAAFVVLASYLRWQPWGNRLDLPLILVWMPLVSVAIVTWHRFLTLPAALGFAWLTPTFLLHNEIRPLSGPASILKTSDQAILFASRGDLRAPYDQAAAAIRQAKAKTVGLIEGPDDWEYPLWRLTGGALHGPRYVDIRSADLGGKPEPAYDVAVCTDVTPHACDPLTRPGWSVTPLSAGVIIATRTG